MSDQGTRPPYRVLSALFENLQQLNDGRLCLSSQSERWQFYLLDGQLLYVSGNRLAVRRFQRIAHYYRPNWQWFVHPNWLNQKAPWEVLLIEQGMVQGRLSPLQLKLILRMVLQECLVELMPHRIVDHQWYPCSLEVSSAYRSAALSTKEVRGVLTKASHLYKDWQTSGLRTIKLSDFPVVADGNPAFSLPGLDRYLRGDATLWDILLGQESSMVKLAVTLKPLIDSGVITFQDNVDLPIPVEPQSSASVEGQADRPLGTANGTTLAGESLTEAASSNKAGSGRASSSITSTAHVLSEAEKPSHLITNNGAQLSQPPLIACIDDSPVLTLSLKKILTAAGYRTLSIPEPMRGFSKLIEHRPDLILLDLMLPNADGYSICKFLRETPAFAKTPIIILTGQDSKIDRMRAQLVGATDFLPKPPKADALVAIIKAALDGASAGLA